MEGPAQVSQQAEAVVEPATAADDGEGARLPDMTYTEQETELRSAVRSVLEDRADFNAVLARTETADTYDTALWRTLAAEVRECHLRQLGHLQPDDYGARHRGLYGTGADKRSGRPPQRPVWLRSSTV